MRVVFLGSPPFATSVFEALAESAHAPVALLTLPDRPKGRGQQIVHSPLAARARSRGIEVLDPPKPHVPEILERLRGLRPDVLVVASYGVILKNELLELAPHGALNVHASLLPRHRGASPIQAAILAGDAHTGVSVQRMVLALDEGDVLVERSTPIGAEETAGELSARLSKLGGAALLAALELLTSGRAQFTPQDASRATYARKIRKEHGHVDWTRPAAELARLTRAMNPWPLARTLDPRGREVALLRTRAVDAPPNVHPGEVLEARERFVIGATSGALEVLELVPAGKRALPAADFLRGARIERGERMGVLASSSR